MRSFFILLVIVACTISCSLAADWHAYYNVRSGKFELTDELRALGRSAHKNETMTGLTQQQIKQLESRLEE